VVLSLQSLQPDLRDKLQDNKNFEDQEYLAALDKAITVPQVWTQYALTSRAADYFAQACKPRAEWKKLDDLSAQLAEFDLRYAAGDYDTAASVLTDIDFDYLLLWGHYRMLIDLHMRLRDKISDRSLNLDNLNGLGFSHQGIGKLKEAIDFYQRGLDNARKIKIGI